MRELDPGSLFDTHPQRDPAADTNTGINVVKAPAEILPLKSISIEFYPGGNPRDRTSDPSMKSVAR